MALHFPFSMFFVFVGIATVVVVNMQFFHSIDPYFVFNIFFSYYSYSTFTKSQVEVRICVLKGVRCWNCLCGWICVSAYKVNGIHIFRLEFIIRVIGFVMFLKNEKHRVCHAYLGYSKYIRLQKKEIFGIFEYFRSAFLFSFCVIKKKLFINSYKHSFSS